MEIRDAAMDVEMTDVEPQHAGEVAGSEHAHPHAAASSFLSASEERQFAIWRSRIHREFEKCHHVEALPPGVALKNLRIEETSGTCVGEFHCFVPFQDGSDALALIPLTALVISMPYDHAQQAQGGDAQYPFLAPDVIIPIGSEYLPSEMVAYRQRQDGTRECALVLPTLTHWSPSNTLVMILHEFIATVQKHDPPVVSRKPTDAAKAPNLMRMRKRDIHSTIYACQEVDTITSTLRHTPMLLQNGNIVLLVPKNSDVGKDDDPFVYVGGLIPLKEIARITPQRGKSITLFFRDRKLSCRTFLMRDTDAIVATIKQMIAATGVKRGRDGGSRDDPGNPLSQLLSFLSPEHSDKAKEMSSKFMGKLGKVASSMTRLFRGDESEDDARQRDHDMLASALNETNALKEAFYRTPSKDRMTEITRRYQSIAEEFALRNNSEGYVERAIEELQHFIEHPTSRRILSEASACEQFNRGIRVGPA
uniref:Uncharacterized protein n=1 Tax=Globisporangium ultimum (strain ATCC 200006 / CBS 805.95 / DAOM BR144) TaxID=431595 RepID=K3WUH6_GLOUD